MQTYIRLILYSTVFITGAAVLIMEVAAVRMLAPYFGSSLFVLSSVLTIVLFALSLGYYFGGKLSDYLPYHIPLYFIITLGGLSLLSLVLIATYTLPQYAPSMPLAFGPLFFSILFFFTPAFLLGIDSPYVIKLLSKDISVDESGRIVGSTFFWSTAGSITGSISSGFFLIPTFGLKETMAGTGLVLMILGIGGGIFIRHLLRKSAQYDSRNDVRLQRPIILAFFAITGILYLLFGHTQYANALYEKHGFYSHIYIFDGTYNQQPARFLKRDTNNSSAIYLESDELVYGYAQFADFFESVRPDAERFLMLGGGAYTIPRKLLIDYPDLHIDVVEIEPALYTLAQEYFRLPQSDRLLNHAMDARVYLQKNTKQYEWIFVDTFSTGHFVPPHLVTVEYLETLKQALTEDGVIIVNFIGGLPNQGTRSLTGSFTKTVQAVFPHVELYTTRPHTTNVNAPQNLMYILRKNADFYPVFSDDLMIQTHRDTLTAADMRLDPDALVHSKDTIFTDNHTPLESLLLKERFMY